MQSEITRRTRRSQYQRKVLACRNHYLSSDTSYSYFNFKVTITNKYQLISYRASLRQAIAQTIDEDLTEIKLELESYLYQKGTITKCMLCHKQRLPTI